MSHYESLQCHYLDSGYTKNSWMLAQPGVRVWVGVGISVVHYFNMAKNLDMMIAMHAYTDSGHVVL